MEQYKKTNEVKIGNKDPRVYLTEGVFVLQKEDQMLYSFTDSYLDKTIDIINVLNFSGLEIDRDYITPIKNIPVTRELINEYVSKIKKYVDRKNEIKFGERDFRIYPAEALYSFITYDKVLLSAVDSYVGSMVYTAQTLSTLGIETDKESRNSNTGRMEIKKGPEETFIPKTGRVMTLDLNKLTLSKCEEILEREMQICTKEYVLSLPRLEFRNLLNGSIELSKVKILGKLNIKKDIIEGYQNPRKGRLENLKVNKIGLTKIPEIYRFTH